MEDSINAYITNFDPETGTIIIPDVYSEVVSSDAKFEVITNVEAKKLVIERQSDVVGHKRLIIAIDKADKKRGPIRKIFTEFFKKYLGFTDDDIIFVNRSEFGEDEEGNDQTKFSAETKEAMKNFGRAIFADRQYGLANQILNIAICEC